MKIVGIQKLTLLDYPGKVACTVFLNGCNFRCPFCHNSELLTSDAESIMTEEELFAFLQSRKSVLDGVCITGGEPTIHPELPNLLRKIRDLGFSVKLDTNGYRPDILRELLSEGLVDYVAMDLKNSPSAYSATVGLSAIDMTRIEESVRTLIDSGVEYEFRTTVVSPLHNEQTMSEMAQWLQRIAEGKSVCRLFLQPFVDRETVPVKELRAPTREELERFKLILESSIAHVSIRGI